MEAFHALLAGLAVGALFAFLRLPVPAPPSIAGVASVVGLTVGYMLMKGLTQ